MKKLNRTTTLIGLIALHGLAKVTFAAMASQAGIRQCASKTAPRCIAEEKLMLTTYRLDDPGVWKSKEWLKILKAEAAAEKQKAKAAELKKKQAVKSKPKAVRKPARKTAAPKPPTVRPPRSRK